MKPFSFCLCVVALMGGHAPWAQARAYTLDELVELAKVHNQGLAAGAQATAAIEARLSEARRSWQPSGELTSILAPSPNLTCNDPPQFVRDARPAGTSESEWRRQNCVGTNQSDFRLNVKDIGGILTRTTINLVQPIYTFGKISAGIDAARAGVAASRSREKALQGDLVFEIRRAYWGRKVAREVLDTLNDGLGYISDAEKTLTDNLKKGEGGSQEDRFRLLILHGEADARVLEAGRLSNLAGYGLRALIGAEAPADLEVDADELRASEVPVKELASYEDDARASRPELEALNRLVLAKQALAELERRKQLPDVVLIGSFTYAYSNSVDDPRNFFYSDPFNTRSVAVAAALRMPLDLGVKNARAALAQAEAEEIRHKRQEAQQGILFEVRRAHAEVVEARARSKILERTAKAGKGWITSVLQKQALGLAETRDFGDALGNFFQYRIRYLQSLFDVNVAVAALSRAVGTDITADKS